MPCHETLGETETEIGNEDVWWCDRMSMRSHGRQKMA